jgi:hypothetical protein
MMSEEGYESSPNCRRHVANLYVNRRATDRTTCTLSLILSALCSTRFEYLNVGCISCPVVAGGINNFRSFHIEAVHEWLTMLYRPTLNDRIYIRNIISTLLLRNDNGI